MSNADLAPCGTYAAYNRHIRRGEPTDRACREAHNVKQKATYRRKQARLGIQVNTSAHIIADYLGTFDAMTLRELVDMIHRKHDIKSETIRRSVYRMLKDRRLVAIRERGFPMIVTLP